MFLGRKIETSEFEAAAVPHLQDLYRTAVHLVRDRTEAHDLVQNAYLQAWKAFHRFEPGTNCRAWLFKILFNEIRHYRRKWFGNRTVSEGEQSFEGTLPYEPGGRVLFRAPTYIVSVRCGSLQNLERPFQVNKPGRVCLPYTKPRKASQGAHIVPAAATSRHIGNFREGLRLYVCVKEPVIRMRPIIGFRPYVFAVWFLLASSEAAFSQTSTWRNITPSGGPQPEARRYGTPNNQSEHCG